VLREAFKGRRRVRSGLINSEFDHSFVQKFPRVALKNVEVELRIGPILVVDFLHCFVIYQHAFRDFLVVHGCIDFELFIFLCICIWFVSDYEYLLLRLILLDRSGPSLDHNRLEMFLGRICLNFVGRSVGN